MTIPVDPRGYAIDTLRGVVHTRHAEHAIGYPRTTLRGITSYDADRPCPECYPATTSEPPGYFCSQCNRRHVEGSGIYDRHFPEEEGS